MHICRLCPRNCGVDRDVSRGFCGVGWNIKIARAALHMWEEPIISDSTGAGTVFFSGCPMKCVFCQNRDISLTGFGEEISPERLTDIFFELEEKGANNIDLVTPTHFAPQIAECMAMAKARGLKIPFVWNSDGYELPDTLKILEDLVDIYMPDFKFMNGALSKKYAGIENYSEVAKEALREMVRQQPETVIEGSLLKKGVLVRHMLMPGCLIDSKRVIRYLWTEYGNGIYMSIMNQYTPCSSFPAMPELERKVTAEEYGSLVDYAAGLGITKAFIQDDETQEQSFIPQFDLEGVLKNESV
ncbi:MAG: radical SAM protein [Oscillospiraceae bacterium]|nr:radical SAM protein [Oscillospiraceae bacterium]